MSSFDFECKHSYFCFLNIFCGPIRYSSDLKIDPLISKMSAAIMHASHNLIKIFLKSNVKTQIQSHNFFSKNIFNLNLEIIRLIFDAIAAKFHQLNQKVNVGLTKLHINCSQIYLFYAHKIFWMLECFEKKEEKCDESKQSRKRRENSKFINVTYMINTL